MPSPPRQLVVAAVLRRGETVLLCRRPLEKRHGGLWEFPGGKVQRGETALRALERELDALRRFADRLKPCVPGILAHCRWPLHTSLLGAINNRIKVIKRMAYGFRDHGYFFLKIRAAFPGIPR